MSSSSRPLRLINAGGGPLRSPERRGLGSHHRRVTRGMHASRTDWCRQSRPAACLPGFGPLTVVEHRGLARETVADRNAGNAGRPGTTCATGSTPPDGTPGSRSCRYLIICSHQLSPVVRRSPIRAAEVLQGAPRRQAHRGGSRCSSADGHGSAAVKTALITGLDCAPSEVRPARRRQLAPAVIDQGHPRSLRRRTGTGAGIPIGPRQVRQERWRRR
jgi:hypothetical protein